MKSFTDLFIKRPVLALVVSFVILIAGLQAMRTINVRQYPRSDIASIKITTVYVGADAELSEHLDDYRTAETELRREQGVIGHQLEGRRDPARSAAGRGDSGVRNSISRYADRLVLFKFHFGHSAA
jgi:hypothetical protein